MKKLILVAAAALALGAAPALAQTPTAAPKLSVDTTTIAEIIKVPAAKAALEKTLPEIADYYDQIGEMTLADVAPMSQGALNETNLKELQAEFDNIK